MAKTISYFSVGVIDPSQGGSGIINTLVLKFLLNRNFKINVYLSSDDKFYREYKSNDLYLSNFEKKNIKINFIKKYPNKTASRYLFGYKYYKSINDLDTIKRYVNEHSHLIKKSDLIISMGLPWAIVINENFLENKIYNIIDFPFYEMRRSEISQEKNFIKKIYKFTKYYSYKNLIINKKYLFKKENVKIFSYSNHSVQKLKNIGLKVSKIKYFVPPQLIIKHSNLNNISLLHIGDLNTTTSRQMIKELKENYLEILNKNTKIEIDFIGKNTNEKFQNYQNIQLNFFGKIENLRKKLSQKKYIFFFPANYIPGIRTRLLTPLSFGIPVIFHSSALVGLPEFEELPFKFNNNNELIEIINAITDINFDYEKYSKESYIFWKNNFYYRKNLADSLFKNI